MKKILGISLLLTTLFASSASAQQDSGWRDRAYNQKAAKHEEENKKRQSQGTDVEVVDSSDGYWLTKGLNDTLYGANGSFNEAHTERNQFRVGEKLNRIYKAPTVIEVNVHGQVTKSPTPPLKIDGQVVKTASPR